MIDINIFTYSGDAELVPLCVGAAVHAFPGCRVHVIDDDNHPMPSETVREIGILGADYRRTDFPRNGNLRGKGCIVGMLEAMLYSTVGQPGYTIKLDSDTLLLRPDWMRQFAHSGHSFFTTRRLDSPFSGICYALRNDLLPAMIQAAKDLKMDGQACEDVVIGSLAHIVASPFPCTSQLPAGPHNPAGRFTAWNFDNPLSASSFYAKSYDVVTFGNNHLHCLPRNACAAPMVRTWDEFKLCAK